MIASAEILRLPALDLERRVLDPVARREAVAQRRVVDEELEGRAGLAHGVDGPVELAVLIVAPAHHGEHGAVRPHRDQRRLRSAVRRARSASAVETASSAAACSSGMSVVRTRIVPRNEPVISRRLLGDPVGEPGAGMRIDPARRERRRVLLGGLGGVRVEPAGRHHRVEHDRAPCRGRRRGP